MEGHNRLTVIPVKQIEKFQPAAFKQTITTALSAE